VNFKFKEACNISSLVVKLGEDTLGRPCAFRYKVKIMVIFSKVTHLFTIGCQISEEQTIEHILPLEGSTFEFDVPKRVKNDKIYLFQLGLIS
jgi:hypothetical protein